MAVSEAMYSGYPPLIPFMVTAYFVEQNWVGIGSAQGAILGKAMSSLESGRDLVLVLVTLQ
jgi:hypothetical protein